MWTASEVFHFRTIRHWRGVILSAGDFLLCLDWILDQAGQEHDAIQWFQFDPAWSVERVEGGYQASTDRENLRVASLLPGAVARPVFCGAIEPSMQGWMSDRAESFRPAPSIGFSAPRAKAAQFATLFQFCRSLTFNPIRCRSNATMSRLLLSWTADGKQRSIEASRQRDGRLSFALIEEGDLLP